MIASAPSRSARAHAAPVGDERRARASAAARPPAPSRAPGSAAPLTTRRRSLNDRSAALSRVARARDRLALHLVGDLSPSVLEDGRREVDARDDAVEVRRSRRQRRRLAAEPERRRSAAAAARARAAASRMTISSSSRRAVADAARSSAASPGVAGRQRRDHEARWRSAAPARARRRRRPCRATRARSGRPRSAAGDRLESASGRSTPAYAPPPGIVCASRPGHDVARAPRSARARASSQPWISAVPSWRRR